MVSLLNNSRNRSIPFSTIKLKKRKYVPNISLSCIVHTITVPLKHVRLYNANHNSKLVVFILIFVKYE
jgi:hypothetical protein